MLRVQFDSLTDRRVLVQAGLASMYIWMSQQTLLSVFAEQSLVTFEGQPLP